MFNMVWVFGHVQRKYKWTGKKGRKLKSGYLKEGEEEWGWFEDTGGKVYKGFKSTYEIVENWNEQRKKIHVDNHWTLIHVADFNPLV